MNLYEIMSLAVATLTLAVQLYAATRPRKG